MLIMYRGRAMSVTHHGWFFLDVNFTSATNMSESYSITPQDQGGIVVIIDMFLSIFSVIMNLVVISAIRDKDNINMYQILIANLCISNLICCVLVSN